MAHADELAGIPLFESLDKSALGQLAPWFDAKTAGEGVRLVGEGAAGYAFFLLTEGAAVVTSDGATLANLGPGDFFGEIRSSEMGAEPRRLRRPRRPSS